ncbi:hypothetical protein C1645_824771, partial [Glomus cerebriforme]
MPPRDSLRRWENEDIIKVFKFLNENFDLWYKSPYVACVKAKEATNVVRNEKSIYNKVHALIKPMNEFLET